MILVTGGAGYIGSITVDYLIKNGYEVVVIDDLSQGNQSAIHKDAKFIYGDYGELAFLVLSSFDIKAVIHLASKAIIEESIDNPLLYFSNNVKPTVTLFEAMQFYNVKKLIFSSTCSVYESGENLTEQSKLNPINPYAQSKLMIEQIIQWLDFDATVLRFFNAAGATKKLGENHKPETHLIPNLLKSNKAIINGNDYDTIDGTCIREYVHVRDLAKAILLSLEAKPGVYNLGNKPYSNLEIVEIVKELKPLSITFGPRREGDPAVLSSNWNKAKQELGWQPDYNIYDIIKSAYDYSLIS